MHIRDNIEPVPPHIPARLVVDFDYFNPPGRERNFHVIWKCMQEENKSDWVWTFRNGGHWIPLRGATISMVLSDYNRFANGPVIIPELRGEGAQVVPVSRNPPEHTPFRALLNPGLSPKAVQAMESAIRATARDLIESFRTAKYCDFVAQYSTQLPIKIFMNLVDLPVSDAPRLKFIADSITRPDGSQTIMQLIGAFQSYLDPYLKARLKQSGSDMLSTIVNGNICGKPIEYKDAMGLCTLLLLGGLDTVASFLGFVFLFLANNPIQRNQLVDDPNMIPAAVDEFFRRFGVSSLVRRVNKDFDIDGVPFREGDLVLVPSYLHGLDEREFQSPMEIDFQRTVGRHSTFGNGPHRCPGSFLARTETRITLEEWLKKIPQFEVDLEKRVQMGVGIVGSVLSLPLRWDL